MLEAESSGVKRLSAQSADKAARFISKQRGLGLEASAIASVADQRMTDMRHVHTDLMRAARLQPAGDKRGDPEFLKRFPMRDRLATSRCRSHRHLLAMDRMSADRRVHHAMGAIGNAPDEGLIFPNEMQLTAVIFEQARQPFMRGVRLGDDEQTRRILVETMHDAGLFDAADAGENSRRSEKSAH